MTDPSSGTVVVTGAAGFIGSHLVDRLRGEGRRVVGVDGLRGTTTRDIADARLHGLSGDAGFELHVADLVTDDLGPLFDGARAVFHLAARPGARDGDRDTLTRDNVDGTAAVVAAAQAAGADLVLASSSSVYGDGAADGPCREDQAVQPLSHYGHTKRSAELLCLDAGVRSVVVRLFTVYGPRQRTDMAFSRFIAAARSGDHAPLYQRRSVTRDYTYVDDAVDGILRAWRHGTAPIYNVSGGHVVDLATASRTIEELVGAELRTAVSDAPPQPSTTHADLTLARADLGYVPAVDLREGLRRQIAATAT